MILKNLSIINFRLHKSTVLNLSNNLNYIIGGNGQGKTTILEAVYYLCTTKNINQSSDAEAVSFDEKFFELKGLFTDLIKNNCRMLFDLEQGKKNYYLDDKQVFRASSIIGKFPVVTLTPTDHFLTQGAPADRRKFVDSVISQSSETYLKILLDYNKTLRQRSSLLSLIKENRTEKNLMQLDAWNIMLAKNGAEIIKRREKFLKEFEVYVKESYYKLMGVVELPSIEYSTIELPGKKEMETELLNLFRERREEEITRGKNLIGPHRDDFIFRINGLELKKFGSQGQHKTFQISLRFGQFFYLKDKIGRRPIFLMDDVFGELDSFRANKISEYLKEVGQAFITMTDMSNSSNLAMTDSDLMIKVEQGKVEYVL